MAEAVMQNMEISGVCPAAAPRMLAILVHTAVFTIAQARVIREGVEVRNPYTLVDAMELVNDEITQGLRTLRAKPRELFKRESH